MDLNFLKNEAIDFLKDNEFEKYKYRMSKNSYDNYLLDSISLAYDLINMLKINIFENEKLKEILDSYQTIDNGFFAEKDFEKRLSESNLERIKEMHTNYITFQSIGAYKAIDRLPNNVITFYDKIINENGIKNYLNYNCPWSISPWGAGGMVDNLGTILWCNIMLGHKEYEKIIDEIFEWLEENQNETNGLWGECTSQGINGLINGGYHLMRGTYFTFNRPFKYSEKIIDIILQDLKTDLNFSPNKAHGCQDMDHFFLLEKCFFTSNGYREKEVKDISRKRLEEILNISKCKDGGFSFEANNSVKVHNYYNISPGLKEGDLLGTVFYLQTIKSITRILEVKFDINDSKTHGI